MINRLQTIFDMLCERTQSRYSFGKPYAKHQMVQEYIAKSRIEIETAKLLTLKAAWLMDQSGHRAARTEIAMAKVYNADVLYNVIDRALQVHGSLGYSSDMPLEMMYRSARMAPLVDGANEVHKVTIAKEALKNYDAVEGWPSEHIPTRREQALKRFSHLLDVGA